MPIFRIHRRAGWTTMPNDIWEHPDLTMKAKGTLGYLLSRPPGWRPRVRGGLERVGPDGREAMAGAVKELIEHGFYRTVKHRMPDGSFDTVSTATDTAWEFGDDEETHRLAGTGESANPSPEPSSPEPGFPASGRPGLIVSKEQQTRISKRSRAHSARPPATADEHAPPARVIGGNGSAPAAANGTANGAATGVPRRIRQPDRKPPGPDTGGGLVEHFTALADRHGVNGPMEISAGALGRNLTSWLRQGMDAEEVRALMDAFYAGRDGWRGDTPLWRRFIGDAYRLRQNRRRTEVDYFAGLEVIGVEDTPFAQALRDDAAKANGTGS